MAFISSSIPNLINGVSQQPPSLRRASQAEAQENAYSSTVEGLVKRDPTEHVADLIGDNLDDVFIHTINRDTFEQYIVLIYPDPSDGQGRIRVFDLNGNEKTVNYEANVAYLDPVNLSYRTGLKALTVADYTFIVNQNVITEMADDKVSTRKPEALLSIDAGNYGTNFNVYINGSLAANYETPDGSSAPHINAIRTDAIAEGLINGTTPSDATSSTNLNSSVGSEYDIEQIGSTIHISRKDGNDFGIRITDSQGDTTSTAIKDNVQRFGDLPVRAVQDFTVQITGVDTDEFNGYYVRYDQESTGTEGVWRETVAPGIKYKIRNETMPHTLVRESDGSFTFKVADWGQRVVGNEASAPEPSFINDTINQVFFHRNRLGILSDDNVVFSRSSEFFQFFVETVTTLLDSDPIDIAAATTQVAKLKEAVPWDERLLVFSDQAQFVLDGNPILTPSTVSMNLATEFSASSRASPVVSGRNVYFGVERGPHGALMEYYRDNSVGVLDGQEVTSHVPKYLSGEIHTMVSQPNEDLIVVAGDREPSAIYPYKFMWQGDQKIQSAWSRWTFNSDAVLGMDFIRSDLYLVINRKGALSLEKIRLNKAVSDPNQPFVAHLDRRVDESLCNVSYDSASRETTIQLPYQVEVDRKFVILERGTDADSSTPGSAFTVLRRPASNIMVVRGRAESFYAGEPYLMRYQFSTPYIQEGQQGTQAVTTGRLNIRFWTIQYAQTGYFEIHVTPDYGETSVYTYNGRTIDQEDNRIGSVAISQGNFKAPIMAKNDEVTIEVKTDSFLPARFQSAEWEALYFSRSKRV